MSLANFSSVIRKEWRLGTAEAARQDRWSCSSRIESLIGISWKFRQFFLVKRIQHCFRWSPSNYFHLVPSFLISQGMERSSWTHVHWRILLPRCLRTPCRRCTCVDRLGPLSFPNGLVHSQKVDREEDKKRFHAQIDNFQLGAKAYHDIFMYSYIRNLSHSDA